VSWVKRILSLKRAGHSGTLDPQVTGVLPVMLGNATKIANFLLTAGKEYICVMRLHKTYPEEKIRAVCNEFIGPIYQRPPLRSSVKRRVRTRRIYYLDILEIHEQNVLFKLGCQAGTYVRKFCFDIGEVLGAGAHMAELRRTRTGPFKEDETLVTLQDLLDVHHFWQEDKNEDLLRRYILPVEQGVSHLPQIIIRDSAIDAVCHGANLAVAGVLQLHSDIKTGDVVALMSQKGELVAVATALYSADHIMDAKSGIITDTKRVVMQEGTYPASWRRKTPKK
jgi:H/ACA ribonucleoprotein complex subunit 4